jgi:hypothetical protein
MPLSAALVLWIIMKGRWRQVVLLGLDLWRDASAEDDY